MSGLRQGKEDGGLIAQAELTRIPMDALKRLCAQATPAQRHLALRHRLLAMGRNAQGLTVYLAADAMARRAAKDLGLTIAANVPPARLSHALQSVFARDCLARALEDITRQRSTHSARQRLSGGQKCACIACLPLMALAWSCGVPCEVWFLMSLIGACLFTGTTALRATALLRPIARKVPAMPRVPDSALPVYTVLVPVLRELPVIRQLIGNLGALDYPATRLDIKIICEETDSAMRAYLRRLHLPPQMEVIVVPRGRPQTKPRALNYALNFARGDLVTVFDAEDAPHPLQLRRAAALFMAEDPPDKRPLGCIQAPLLIGNRDENWLTHQFALEYSVLFRHLLPTLADAGMPVPLGGTSNHFPRAVLRATGGWDPYNVTEDADLGLRLHRMGFRVHMLESYTIEDAPTRFRVWRRQRTRWMKGWMQSWLVHMRAPGELAAASGWAGLLGVHGIFAGVVVSALIHPICIACVLLALARPGGDAPTLHGLLTGFGLTLLALSYTVSMALILKVSPRNRRWPALAAAVTLPVYWLLISYAAWMGLVELIVAPFRWNKTTHRPSRPRSRPAHTTARRAQTLSH